MDPPEASKPAKRLRSLGRVLDRLDQALREDEPSELEMAGVIHFFEMAVDLFWKSMKDALLVDGLELGSPKPVLRAAAESGWVQDVRGALKMIDARNEFTHRYDEGLLDGLHQIRDRFLPIMVDGRERLQRKLDEAASS